VLAMMADLQSHRINSEWPSDQRSDAGLVCFAIRETLRTHTDEWRNRFQVAAPVPSIEKYNFPLTPLGEKLFRTKAGAYKPTDLSDGTFLEFVDASRLRDFNATFIGRDWEQAQKGDLLFFRRPGSQPPLVMIFLKDVPSDPSGKQDWLAYYAGGGRSGSAEVKEARLSLLDQDSDLNLRPVESNRNFLGFYRLKILK
jgi:uncharacterized protein YfaT (DUF1175 family)